MISIKQFKEIVNHADPDWCLEFGKWEHMSPTSDGPYQVYKGWPNRTGARICDISDRYDFDGTKIRKVILEDEDDGFEGHPQDWIDKFANGLSDNDNIEFVLEVEETPCHLDYIQLKIYAGDKGYSDKFMFVELDEIDDPEKEKSKQSKLDTIAKTIWDTQNLEDHIFWQPEMWNNNEFDPVCGSVEFDGWKFTTNENSDYAQYTSPEGKHGEILRN